MKRRCVARIATSFHFVPSCLRAFVPFLVLAAIVPATFAAELVKAKDGSGAYGYDDTPVLPWCGYRVHDANRPYPKKVDPGPAPAPAPIPSDAIVLFDGKNLDQWLAGENKLVDGCIEAGGAVSPATKESFGSFQLHIEWMPPKDFKGPWYNQGNNGVLIHGLYEIQIFDSYNEKIYADGMSGAIYGQTPPLVNAMRPPGEWETYDIAFTAPVFDGERLVKPARVTVFHNGILVQNDEEIHGPTGHRILPAYKKPIVKGPIILAGHGCPVRFRNIWLRPL